MRFMDEVLGALRFTRMACSHILAAASVDRSRDKAQEPGHSGWKQGIIVLGADHPCQRRFDHHRIARFILERGTSACSLVSPTNIYTCHLALDSVDVPEGTLLAGFNPALSLK
jgi:hypothetical protein